MRARVLCFKSDQSLGVLTSYNSIEFIHLAINLSTGSDMNPLLNKFAQIRHDRWFQHPQFFIHTEINAMELLH